MGKPQFKPDTAGAIRNENRWKPASEDPFRPIAEVQGEVMAIQMRIASRLGQTPACRSDDLEARLERLVSAVSRMSGYALMAGTVAGLVFLCMPG